MRNTVSSYIDYLHAKQRTTITYLPKNYGNEHVSYIQCYNSAVSLKDTYPNQALDIFKQLYEVKKDPEVLEHIQDLENVNIDCGV